MSHHEAHDVGTHARAPIWILSLAAAVATMLGTAHATADDEAEIRDLTQQYAEAYSQRDAAAVAEMFTEDALFVAPDGTRLDGRDDIESMFRDHFDSGSLPLSMGVIEAVVFGDIAYSLTTYAGLGGDGEPLVEGYGLSIWIQVDGAWMWHRNVANVIVSEPDETGSGCTPSTQPGSGVVAIVACP